MNKTSIGSNIVKFSLGMDLESLLITANSSIAKLREEVTISNIEGLSEEFIIAFNGIYISDILKNNTSEECTFDLLGSVNPCLVKGKNASNERYLLLPVRLANK